MDKMRYYFEICFKSGSKQKDQRAEITKEKAYGILHLYGLKDSDWKRECICLMSNGEVMHFLVRTEKELDVTITR